MFHKIGILFFTVLIYSSLPAQQTVRIELGSIPANTPENSSVYLAGNFNGWNPKNEKYQFQKNGNVYSIELLLKAGNYEFKITRGDWNKVESTSEGKDISNRTLNVGADNKVVIKIDGWKDLLNTAGSKQMSTANQNVKVIDTAFFIPQLNRTRRIWVYLPNGYNSSGKKYPVLYMHDGQNVFDDATSFSGEWGIDEALDTLGIKTGECIVVAIDNGGSKRLNEYCPYDFSVNNMSGDGDGKRYVDFLVKTLKPFIDKNYRTLRKKENTFIAGSSMGGLISMYAILKYPKKFGGAGVFSPAFWVGPKIFDDIKSKGKKVKGKIYFYAGDAEGETMVPLTIKAFNDMLKVSKTKMATVLRAEGIHNEARWRKEFPLFYKWLMN